MNDSVFYLIMLKKKTMVSMALDSFLDVSPEI